MRFSKLTEEAVLASLRAEPDTCITFPPEAYRNGTILIYRDNLTWRLPRYLDEQIHFKLREDIYLLSNCKTKGCMNPNHFVASRRPYKERRACINGHRYTKKNLLPEGQRDRCRECYEAKLARRRSGGAGYPRGWCHKGHKLTPENSYLTTDRDGVTHRRCKQCHLARTRAARAARRMENR